MKIKSMKVYNIIQNSGTINAISGPKFENKKTMNN